MTGVNVLTVNQTEMCRLIALALASDTLKGSAPFSVSLVEFKKSSSGYGDSGGFEITLDEPKQPEAAK